jgi:hypothetical protein
MSLSDLLAGRWDFMPQSNGGFAPTRTDPSFGASAVAGPSAGDYQLLALRASNPDPSSRISLRDLLAGISPFGGFQDPQADPSQVRRRS